MAITRWSEEERSQLQELIRCTHSAKELRLAQALLELDQGPDGVNDEQCVLWHYRKWRRLHHLRRPGQAEESETQPWRLRSQLRKR
jgi:hypothetical protein